MATDVAISPNAAGTWRTAVVVGAADGIMPETISPITLQGNKVPIESIGISDVEFMKTVHVDANPTLNFIMRHSGMYWSFLAHWMGADTKVFSTPLATHDLNYAARSTMVSLTLAVRINADNNKILEWPSLKPQKITMAPNSEGFWEMNVECLGNTIEALSDAASGSTEFGNITYLTRTQEMIIRGNTFRINNDAGALDSADEIKVADLTITLDRPYETDEVTEGTTALGGAQVQIPEPVQNGSTIVTIGWNEPDFISFASLVDDFKDDIQYKADLITTETFSSNLHTVTQEFALMEYMPPDAGLDRQSRVPVQREFNCVTAQSTPTGMTNANPIHVEVINTDDFDYTTGAV